MYNCIVDIADVRSRVGGTRNPFNLPTSRKSERVRSGGSSWNKCKFGGGAAASFFNRWWWWG
ncbi:hypothetical protein Leryth_018144 [Lithospermum erythrorhizon]|nr:hypothetical protein Leryth_018144 [Lithospermum erythrorhizon]